MLLLSPALHFPQGKFSQGKWELFHKAIPLALSGVSGALAPRKQLKREFSRQLQVN
jgi:hypothetical protein